MIQFQKCKQYIWYLSAILHLLQWANYIFASAVDQPSSSNGSTTQWKNTLQTSDIPYSSKGQQGRRKTDNKTYSKQNLNKILSIHNDTDFQEKVVQMMMDDDSDVLKDINEDEEPVGKNSDMQPYTTKAGKSPDRTRVSRSEMFPPDHVYRYELSKKYESMSWKRTTIARYENTSTVTSTNMDFSLRNFPNYTDYTTVGPPPLQSETNTPPPPEADVGGTTPTPSTEEVKPSRMCKPGPPLVGNPYLPNCLIIGDSIAASYFYAVAEALRGKCVVQLSPYSKAGAALDSKYGLECLQLLLSTTDLQPTHYDAIIFNFGLHDINYQGTYTEEYNDEKEYARNLGRIKKKLLQTGATVTFALTTPVTYDKHLNDIVISYNDIAKRVMKKGTSIASVDLYQMVIDECGIPPFEKCYMTKKPKDVHYSVAGAIMLGKRIAAELAKILQARGQWEPGSVKPPNYTNPLYDLRPGSRVCPVPSTKCPFGTSCFPNVVSRSGYGCCMLHDGVDCLDNWHCCPSGTRCHPQCKETWCTCLS